MTTMIPFVYRLNQLIKAKYGRKSALGWYLVARWVNHDKRDSGRWLPDTVKSFARQTDKNYHSIDAYELYKLCQLFGLKDISELYTDPNDMPAHYNNHIQAFKDRGIIPCNK